MSLIINIIIVVMVASIARSQTPDVPCPSRCRSCDNNVAECAKRSLTAPPRDYPQGTRTINLEGNHIRVIAERTFGNLDSAEVLKISGNKIVALRNDAFSPLPNLIVLDLTDNRISRINRRAFNNLNKLRTLSLSKNKIEAMESIFQFVPNLFQLNMANNRITTIGQHDLSALPRVHNVDFRDNLISSIHPQAFKELVNLRYLFLNNNPLMNTPRFEFSSQVLHQVDFSSCELIKVPGPFPASVTDLRLGNNKIMQVNRTDFLNITDLQLLTLNDNELHVFDDGALAHLTELREVWLRQNNFVYIPRGIPDNVRKVDMGSNNIQQIEAGIFSNKSRLDYLTVESNQINRIQPNTFKGLGFLNTLNFQGNQLQNLEQNTFVDLGSLSTLLLSNNPLVRIEAGAFRNLGNLTQLLLNYIDVEDFELGGNFMQEMLRLQTLQLVNSPGLAGDLMNMVNDPVAFPIRLNYLKQLDLSYNTLQWISPRIREVFPNLSSMPLDGNPLRCSQRLKWLRDWMVSSDVSFHKHNEIICETPARLKDRAVRSIEDDEWASDDEVNIEEVNVATLHGQQLLSEVAQASGSSQPIRARGQSQGQGVGKRSKDEGEGGKGKDKTKGKGKGQKGKKGDKKNKKDKNKKEKKSKNENKNEKKNKKEKQNKEESMTQDEQKS